MIHVITTWRLLQRRSVFKWYSVKRAVLLRKMTLLLRKMSLVITKYMAGMAVF